MAAYTFYKLVMSILGMIRARKEQSLLLITIRNIGHSDALVSMLSLQTALFAAFGQDSGDLVPVMNAATGAVVCLGALALGIHMVYDAGKRMKMSNRFLREEFQMINILVVDDDADLNRIVCTYLSDSGFQTKGVLSANEALEEMYNSLYELIVSDIMMPEIF